MLISADLFNSILFMCIYLIIVLFDMLYMTYNHIYNTSYLHYIH